VGAELYHADRRTDRHDEINSRFLKFCENAYKVGICLNKWKVSCRALGSLAFKSPSVVGEFDSSHPVVLYQYNSVLVSRTINWKKTDNCHFVIIMVVFID